MAKTRFSMILKWVFQARNPSTILLSGGILMWVLYGFGLMINLNVDFFWLFGTLAIVLGVYLNKES
jgi:hypothetical protein